MSQGGDFSEAISRRTTKVWKDQHEFAYEENRKYDFLYHEWIYPYTYENFRGLEVLEAGSGPGVQTRLFAQVAKKVVAVDKEAIATTRNTTRDVADKIEYVCADIASMDLGRRFDVVNCVGVIQHTDDPAKTFRNLVRHTKEGGKVIIWAYAQEGNFLMRTLVEPLRKRFLDNASHRMLWALSWSFNVVLAALQYSIYLLPLTGLPYYEYFQNARRMSFRRNAMNIYDKLNAPQTHFISEQEIRSWFNADEFNSVHISMYKGVSWRASGVRKARGPVGASVAETMGWPATSA